MTCQTLVHNLSPNNKDIHQTQHMDCGTMFAFLKRKDLYYKQKHTKWTPMLWVLHVQCFIYLYIYAKHNQHRWPALDHWAPLPLSLYFLLLPLQTQVTLHCHFLTSLSLKNRHFPPPSFQDEFSVALSHSAPFPAPWLSAASPSLLSLAQLSLFSPLSSCSKRSPGSSPGMWPWPAAAWKSFWFLWSGGGRWGRRDRTARCKQAGRTKEDKSCD